MSHGVPSADARSLLSRCATGCSSAGKREAPGRRWVWARSATRRGGTEGCRVRSAELRPIKAMWAAAPVHAARVRMFHVRMFHDASRCSRTTRWKKGQRRRRPGDVAGRLRTRDDGVRVRVVGGRRDGGFGGQWPTGLPRRWEQLHARARRGTHIGEGMPQALIRWDCSGRRSEPSTGGLWDAAGGGDGAYGSEAHPG